MSRQACAGVVTAQMDVWEQRQPPRAPPGHQLRVLTTGRSAETGQPDTRHEQEEEEEEVVGQLVAHA